ncbi:serine/threonine protein kinase [Candidatus Micrarchaeota archaeon]|nr:serine/threonine protein kinase [Candidatus Micrarchaeota archaeon]
MHKTVSSRRPLHKHTEPPERGLFETVNGRYRPLQELGCGAVFLVHLADDLRTGNTVAIKRLRGDMLANKNAHYAMETEARALSLARHPGVPVLYSSSPIGPDPYLAEEFKDGLPFALNYVQDARTAVLLSISACGILSALHGAGIVHRDLKPGNLVLGCDRRSVSLIDYGFSIVPGMQDFAMRVDVPVGTPMFMAPEQTYPKVRVDFRADIYALGMVLYQFLSGWYPYTMDPDKDEGEEYFRAHRSEPAVPLHVRKPAIPRRLSYAVARALEKEPRRRYQDADEFADALSESLGFC